MPHLLERLVFMALLAVLSPQLAVAETLEFGAESSGKTLKLRKGDCTVACQIDAVAHGFILKPRVSEVNAACVRQVKLSFVDKDDFAVAESKNIPSDTVTNEGAFVGRGRFSLAPAQWSAIESASWVLTIRKCRRE